MPDPRAVKGWVSSTTGKTSFLIVHLDQTLAAARVRHSMTSVVADATENYRWQGETIFRFESQIWQSAWNGQMAKRFLSSFLPFFPFLGGSCLLPHSDAVTISAGVNS